MTTVQRVKNILAASRMARNSDLELQIIFMQKAGMNLTPQQVELFRTLPSMETLRRDRQALQAAGHYPADQRVKRARQLKGHVVRQTIAGAEPEQVDKIMQAPQVQQLLDWIN